MIVAILVHVCSAVVLPQPEYQQTYRETTAQDLQLVLQSAGAIDVTSAQAYRSESSVRFENERYLVNMFEYGPQLRLFKRRTLYFKDHPFDAEKADAIPTTREAEARIIKFLADANLGWGAVNLSDARLVSGAMSRSFTDYEDQRRVFAARVSEQSTDSRRSRTTLRSASISIDAQYGHVLSFASTYVPPAGPWRLTVSEASARQAAMAEWSNRGITFKPEQVTLQPKWIRTNVLFDYQPDEVLIAGWSVEARRNPTDKELAARIWVHGETGRIVYSVVPFRSTG